MAEPPLATADGTEHEPQLVMKHETDLPCSDCGTGLRERTVNARELPGGARGDGRVTIAECPSCGARYYPREAISKLSDSHRRPLERGDS